MSSSDVVSLGGGRYTYDEGRLLGAGAFGQVFKGQSREGEAVAVKVLNMAQNDMMYVFKEITILLGLKHDNIVQVLECFPVSRPTTSPSNITRFLKDFARRSYEVIQDLRRLTVFSNPQSSKT